MATRRRATATTASIALVAALVACFSGVVLFVDAAPHRIVTSGKASCVTVSVPGGSTLRVDYEAPDLDRERGPAFLTVFLNRPVALGGARPGPQHWHHRPPGRGREDADMGDEDGMKPTSLELQDTSGVLTHFVPPSTGGGDLDVCIRASYASVHQPMRFSIRASTDHHHLAKDGNNKDDDERRNLIYDNQAKVEHHLSNMEREVVRLTDDIADILREADYAKERESEYRDRTVEMHKAAAFWPAVQWCLLIATGVAQAGHVVKFFQSRNII